MVHLVRVADGWLADRILGSYGAAWRISGGCPALAAPATLPAAVGRLTTALRFLSPALAPWLRRTMHPVH
ncbi:hypothetical protein ACWGE1_11370 [Streptomyces sp. NPDC054932]